MALINTTTTGVLGSTFYADGSGDLTIQQNGVTVNKITSSGLLNGAGGGPAFSATCGALTLAASTFTKMPFNGETFDTNNNYDPTTNYRFTPTVAGYYWIKVQYFLGVSTGRTVASIYKNGGDVCQTLVLSSNTNGGISVVSQGLISFNGTTDYVEAYGYQESGGTGAINTNGGLTTFSGYMVRGA
jgi:hypothetical protein